LYHYAASSKTAKGIGEIKFDQYYKILVFNTGLDINFKLLPDTDGQTYLGYPQVVCGYQNMVGI